MFHLVPGLRMRGTPPLSQYVFMEWNLAVMTLLYLSHTCDVSGCLKFQFHRNE